MTLLPARFIHDDDKNFLGDEIFSLAKLYHQNLSVVDFLVVFPPVEQIKKILKKYNEVVSIENHKTSLRNELLKIDIPPQLKEHFKEKSLKQVWLQLLDRWLNQLTLNLDLTAQTVIFSKQTLASGKIFFDRDLADSVIEIDHGQLNPKQMQFLDQLVTKLDKVLVISHKYHWISEGKNLEDIKIIRVSPHPAVLHTQVFSKETFFENDAQFKDQIRKIEQRSATKIFTDISEKLIINYSTDGVIISFSHQTDFETAFYKLIEAGLALPTKPILFTVDTLIEKANFNKIIDQFYKLRISKGLPNLQLVLSNVNSLNDFILIKRDIAKLGYSRKGNRKLWFEIATGENCINLEEYLTLGFDGLILNLDKLFISLIQTPFNNWQTDINDSNLKTLFKFIEPSLVVGVKKHLPILATGQLVSNESVLKYLVSQKVWGLTIDLDQDLETSLNLKKAEVEFLHSLL